MLSKSDIVFSLPVCTKAEKLIYVTHTISTTNDATTSQSSGWQHEELCCLGNSLIVDWFERLQPASGLSVWCIEWYRWLKSSRGRRWTCCQSWTDCEKCWRVPSCLTTWTRPSWWSSSTTGCVRRLWKLRLMPWRPRASAYCSGYVVAPAVIVGTQVMCRRMKHYRRCYSDMCVCFEN